jgi:hypothetical protein
VPDFLRCAALESRFFPVETEIVQIETGLCGKKVSGIYAPEAYLVVRGIIEEARLIQVRSGFEANYGLGELAYLSATELCGREDRLKVSYNLSESGHDARVSLLTGNALSHRANITASKSYNTQKDFRFDTKTFMELRNAHSVTIAYDGLNPIPPTFCYLKPYYNDPNKSYFQQLEDGEL